MDRAMHAGRGVSRSEAVQRSGPTEPEKAEQPAPGVRCGLAFLHWSSTRAARGTDCDPESGAAFSKDEARRPAAGMGFDIRIKRPEKSFGDYISLGPGE